MRNPNYHILVVANTSWNIYNFRLNVIKFLLEHDFKVTVLSPIDEYVRYTEKYPEVEHIGLRHLDRDSTNPYKDLRLLIEFVNHYRKIRPDLILHYTVKPNIYGGIAAKIVGLKSIAVITGLGYPFIHAGMAGSITKSMYRVSNRWHEKVVFENEDDLNLFGREKLIKPGRGISIKGCGVDTHYYVPDPNPKTNGAVTFTFIGRLLYDKGIREFVEAAHLVKRSNPHVRFWLIGQIDEGNPSAIRKSDLVNWVKDPDIYYLGSKEDVRPYIKQSDCVVLPSYREAIARSLTEAMSMSKPVIGTDTAGVREAIEDQKNGYLVKVKDAQALADAMNSFISLSPDDRRKMGEHGRQKVLQEFDDEKIASEIGGIIKKVLSNEK